MRLPFSCVLGLTILFLLASGAAAKEDPEVSAYVKKKGWSLYTDTRIWDGKRLIYLVVENRGNERRRAAIGSRALASSGAIDR